MTDNTATLSTFLATVKNEQVIWALQDKSEQEWVILDSTQFEQTEVMPVWSSKAAAAAHCEQEWQAYQPAAISVAEWLEYWVDDLKDDNIVIGVDWPIEDAELLELDLSEFSQNLAEIEKL